MNIAILGASSHIAKGLIYNFLKQGENRLFLFSRGMLRCTEFLNYISNKYYTDIFLNNYRLQGTYEEFNVYEYDVIINCIGTGTFNKMNGDFTSFFTFPNEFDNLCIDYLKKNRNTLYIAFSSGAIYGKMKAPAELFTENKIRPNKVTDQNYYMISKLYSEAKHRSYSDLNIVDLRIFSYFSRFMDSNDKYFITEIIDSIREDKEMSVVNDSFIKDYLHPDDLFQAINNCIINRTKINDVIDINSKEPISKINILKLFKKNYGLRYKIDDNFIYKSASGDKGIYYSNYERCNLINYQPSYTSEDTLMNETKYILNNDNEYNK